MNNKDKIILDLCGGTGSWSKPYTDAGYTVINVTLPKYDILLSAVIENRIWIGGEKILAENVYGILCAPPCTQFSFARTNAKLPRNLDEGMRIVNKCLEIIQCCQKRIINDCQKKPPLKFWALENPKGMLEWFLGKPCYEFNPYDFGDDYKKKTQLWGHFNLPKKNPIKCNTVKFDKLASKEIHPEMYGKLNRQERRSITPQGFAKTFYEANK